MATEEIEVQGSCRRMVCISRDKRSRTGGGRDSTPDGTSQRQSRDGQSPLPLGWPFLMQPRIQLTFRAASAHCCHLHVTALPSVSFSYQRSLVQSAFENLR